MDSHEAIYLIDSDPVSAQSTESVLGTRGHLVRRFVSSGEFMDHIAIAETGCVIATLSAGVNSCIEIQKELMWRGSDLTIIAIFPRGAIWPHIRTGKAAAITILEHPFTSDELLRFVDDGFAKSHERLENRNRLADLERKLSQLTESEKSVLRFLMKGRSHKNISNLLGISTRSVDRRRKSVLDKMGVATLQELIGLLAELQFGV